MGSAPRCYRRWLDVVAVDAEVRPWALAMLLLYPYGWFLYGPVYSDSTFLLLVLVAFLAVEADRLPVAALAAAQSEYHSTLPKWLVKAGLPERWATWDDPIYTLTITVQALIMLGVFLTAPAVGRRFGWGYATFVMVLAAIPTVGSIDYLGAGRYMLAAFPTMALVAERLAGRPRLRWVWFAACGAALVVMSAGFAQSRMLS